MQHLTLFIIVVDKGCFELAIDDEPEMVRNVVLSCQTLFEGYFNPLEQLAHFNDCVIGECSDQRHFHDELFNLFELNQPHLPIGC